MPVQTVRDLSERLPGLRLWNYYGQTELGPLATYLRPGRAADQAGLGGQAGAQRDDARGRRGHARRGRGRGRRGRPPLAAGHRGLLQRPRADAAAFAGGWFHSGDLATVDADGYLTIVDRKKDMINSGGENVSSREVEEVLYRHPAVAEVAVVGIPDDRWIEAVCAVVVARRRGRRGRRAARVRPRGPGAVQGAQERRLRRRAAQEPEREDPQARAARSGGRVELNRAAVGDDLEAGAGVVAVASARSVTRSPAGSPRTRPPHRAVEREPVVLLQERAVRRRRPRGTNTCSSIAAGW